MIYCCVGFEAVCSMAPCWVSKMGGTVPNLGFSYMNIGFLFVPASACVVTLSSEAGSFASSSSARRCFSLLRLFRDMAISSISISLITAGGVSMLASKQRWNDHRKRSIICPNPFNNQERRTHHQTTPPHPPPSPSQALPQHPHPPLSPPVQ